MGATFSHLAGYFTEDGIGYASAFNTLGAALAPFVFGLVLLPSVGYGATFYCAVGTYVLLFLVAGMAARQNVRWILAGVGVTAVVGVLTYSSLVLIAFPADERLVAQRVSLQGVVSVTERGTPSKVIVPERILWMDQRFPMGGSPGFVTKRMGQLPMLVAREPRDIAYLGVGTGITAGAALIYPVHRVTAVELVPEVIDMLPWFDASNNNLRHDRRVTLIASDARRFIEATTDTYDLIVADLYHPNRDGTGSLYTTEHFANIRARLRDGGLFVQWLPLYQLRAEDLKTIVRTFLAVFPTAQSMMGNYSGNERFALLGWGPRTGSDTDGPGIDVARAKMLLQRQKSGGESVFDGIEDVLASYMLDNDALRRYAGAGPVNTDINQKITFDAAGNINRTERAQYGSLETLLPYRTPFPDNFIHGIDAPDLLTLRKDVGPYADALSHYLAGEILRLKALPNPIPPAAIAEYLKAYQADPRVRVPSLLAELKLLDSALQNPVGAEDLVSQLWLANPNQASIETLRMQLKGVASPRDVRSIISRFREQVVSSPNP
jgi:spermidine synthase